MGPVSTLGEQAAAKRKAEEERIKFIRDAAIRIWAACSDEVSPVQVPRIYEHVWNTARALWDAKPQDC